MLNWVPSRGSVRGYVLLFAAVVCLFVSWERFGPRPFLTRRTPSQAARTRSDFNLLVITLDTTRADVVGVYGGRAVTPSIDELASTGVLFEQASTVAPLTLPAHSSLFTALFPPG